jgi:putative transposase
VFLCILEQTRKRYRFVVLGYVIMPEHFHLLISEPQIGDPSKVMQVVKQRFAQQLFTRPRKRTPLGRDSLKINPRHVWQERFYDFSVWTEQKRIDKLRYMHRNPVKRGLANSPDQWPWSSFRFYMFGENGLVRVNETSVMKMQLRAPLSG